MKEGFGWGDTSCVVPVREVSYVWYIKQLNCPKIVWPPLEDHLKDGHSSWDY